MFVRNIKPVLLIMTVIMLVLSLKAVWSADSKIYDQCYISKVKGIKIGYSCNSQTINQDKKYIITNIYSQQEFKRFGFGVKITQDFQFIEDTSGNPISFTSKVDSFGENINIKGEFTAPGKVKVTSLTNGISKVQDITISKNVLFPYAIDKLFKNNKEKDNITYLTVDTSTGFRVITVSARKIGSESLPQDNLPENYMKYRVVSDILPNIESFEWHNADGKLVKEHSSLLNIESIATSRENISEQAGNLDILAQSLIPVDTQIVDPFKIAEITYKIETQNINNLNELIISDERQKIIQVKDNVIYLKVKNESQPSNTFNYPVSLKGYSEYLKSGPFIISNNSKVKNIANTLIGQDSDAYKIAKKMDKWVYNSITKKDFAVGFANTLDILKTKEGDCTEHSILLASLLRSANIPSKIVVGLIYTDTPQRSFGYHMWVKAYIGKWIDLDPSFYSDNFSPVHIAIAESSLNDLSDKTNIALNIIKSFSNLKINILNYTNLDPNVTSVKPPALNPSKDEKFSIIDYLKNGNSPMRKISLKDNNASDNLTEVKIKKDSMDDYIRSGYYNFSIGQISQAVDDFSSAAKLISYNDDFSDIQFSAKLASLGLFNLTDSQLKIIYDPEIWGLPIANIKRIYYPKKLLLSDQEIILAEALSKIDFQKDFDGAIILISDNQDKLNYSDYTHYLLAKAYFEKRNYSQALNEIDQAIKINSANLAYKFELIKIYTEKNQYKEAQKAVNYLKELKIKDSKFANDLKVQEYWLNFKINKKNPVKSQLYLAKYYESKGDYVIATEILENLASKKVKDANIYAALGNLYSGRNEFDKALDQYKTALKYNKSNIDALIGIGNIDFGNRAYEDALSYYTQAEKLNPDNSSLLIALAQDYTALLQIEKANEYYYRVLKIDDFDSVANYYIGLMYSSTGDYDKAVKKFKKSLSVDFMQTGSWLGLARIEINKKNNFLAKSYLVPVNNLDDKNPLYYYYMGVIEKANENYASAKDNFKKAIEIKPDFTEAQQELDSIN